MKNKLVYICLFLISVSVMFFQNCSGSNFQSLSSSLGSIQHDSNLTLHSADGSQLSQSDQAEDDSNPVYCAAGTIKWTVGNNECEAQYSQLTVNANKVTDLYDTSSPNKGKASIRCVSKNKVEFDSRAKTCVKESTASDQPPVQQPPVPQQPNIKPRMYGPSYYAITQNKAIAYTGALVTDTVSYCVQKSGHDYKCVNGAIAQHYREIPRPTAPLSSTQELLWESESFFTMDDLDFASYEVHFYRKSAQGNQEYLGATSFEIRLPNDVVNPGQSGTYSYGNKVRVRYNCPAYENTSPGAGWLSYQFTSQNCYYKIEPK